MHAQPPTLFTLLISLLWRYQRRLHAVNRSARNEHPSFSSARLTLFWPTFAAIVISGCADSNESFINEEAQIGPSLRPALIATLEQPSDRILHKFVGRSMPLKPLISRLRLAGSSHRSSPGRRQTR